MISDNFVIRGTWILWL